MTQVHEPYIAVASDMDGTLLLPDHTASKETEQVLKYVSTVKKIPFIFATGRHHVDVLATKAKLGLSGYVITSNGARVHDNDGKVIIQNNIAPHIAQRLALERIDDPEVVTSVYQDDLWLISREAKDLTEFYKDNADVFYYRLFDAKHHSSFEHIYKVYYTSDNLEKLHELEDHLRAAYSVDEITAAYSLPFCLEVSGGGVNKGQALGQLLSQYLFPATQKGTAEEERARTTSLMQRCISFGDGDNDFSLVTGVGHGCLMGNAQKPLLDKVAAHIQQHPEAAEKLETVKSNAENGVAAKLREVFGVTETVLPPAV